MAIFQPILASILKDSFLNLENIPFRRSVKPAGLSELQKDFSIVIPTRNRKEDLNRLLSSIAHQTLLPKEIIVVDDSDDSETRILVEYQKADFQSKKVQLEYMRGDQKNRSISAARNIGAKNANGSIVCFLDDDVILDKNYVEEIASVFETQTTAIGVQGYILNYRAHSGFSNALNRVCYGFPRDYFEPNKCTAFPFVYPQPLTKLVECQWCVGANSSYQKDILNDFRFDENLAGYSLCEDLDLSVRLLNRYPHPLFMTPYAKLVHRGSPLGRVSKEKFFSILVQNTTYFFYKNVAQNLRNNIVFYWGFFIGRFVLRFACHDAEGAILLAKAIFKTLKNFDSVKVCANFKPKIE